MSEIISINPTTEAELGRIPAVDREGVDIIVQKASEAFSPWSKKPLSERLKYLKRLSDIILEQADEIAQLITREQGKTVVEAKINEILPVLAIIKSIRKNAKKILSSTPANHEMILFSHKKSQFRFIPYGVVVIISPWNYPFSVPVPEIIAAIASGNTVVFKPAPGTALIGRKINQLFQQAGFPEGVVNTLFITDDLAPYLVGHKDVGKIIFTGSTKTGQEVMARASAQLSPVLLELGGKDPALVAADADIKRSAKGIVWGIMFNCGQVCAGVERVYVERPVAQQFIDACIEEVGKLKVGDPSKNNIDVGPLENERQLKLVESHVEDALEKGAKIACGGSPVGGKGFFFEPTILLDVNHSMKVMTEETFGPVLPIMVVDSADQAIEMANDTPFGLSAYGWTANPITAEKFQRELKAGIVMINDATAMWGEPNAPWGGFKNSGIGKTRSKYGLLEMVQVKFTSHDKGKNHYNLWWFPYDQSAREIGDQAINLLFAKKWHHKIKPLFRLLKNKRFVTTVHWLSIVRNIKKVF